MTVEGLAGFDGGELAGIVHRDDDGRAIGGFLTGVAGDDFTTSQAVLRLDTSQDPAPVWPRLSEDELILRPGRYTLMLWADTDLGGYNPWLPVNSDGEGLAGCVFTFEIDGGAVTEVEVAGRLWESGYLGVCWDVDDA